MRRWVFLCCLLVSASPGFAGESIRLANRPALSPDGKVLGSCGPGARLAGSLPASGAYRIDVKSTASQDATNTSYDIDVEIK